MALRKIEIDGRVFDISYEIINPSQKQNVIFLHGWGSNKEIMKCFKNYFKDFRHIYIDMPGFGKSSNEYVLITNDYAKIIEKLLNELNISKDIIIGHSFGGKVATLLKPKLLVLLASSGIIMPKPLNVKIKIKIYKTLKTIGLSGLRKYFVSGDAKGMSENMYETFKNVVDEDFSKYFAEYNGSVLIFGGKEDTAVPEKAIKKQADLLKSKNIMLNGDHYFFFNSKEAEKNRKIIENEILKAWNV
ncbi:alpha/beta fold hydrolase [Nautilia lithotrophica]